MHGDAGAWYRERRPIDVIYRPFQRFVHQATSGGVVLLASTLVALAWANSPWKQLYHDFWRVKLAVGAGPFLLSYTLHHWINDGLMVVFFFVVGLEIKREVLTGELASPRRAMLPIAAAAGGMIVPALIYSAFNAGTPEIAGWGIPMATDIAFALGILALLGDRVPLALKVFLTALAIVDDLGAVMAIALFYTSRLHFLALVLGLGILLVMFLLNRLGVRSPLVYLVFGILVWLCFLQSGVHATIAGVLAALTIPARTIVDEEEYLARGRFLIGEMEKPEAGPMKAEHRERVRLLAQNLETASESVQPPLHRLERRLHPWQSFFIMPVFALANAGIPLGQGFAENLAGAAALGIVIGLVIGKQVGITAFAWLAVRLGLASLPAGVRWKQIYGVGWLGGIGFTMSLFIAELAFTDEAHLVAGKAGILTGSLLAGLGGYLLLRRWLRS